MENEIVLVGIPNDGEIGIRVDILRNWEPERVVTYSDVVYFISCGDCFSMRRSDFENIFKK